jgi:hypothetical protein
MKLLAPRLRFPSAFRAFTLGCIAALVVLASPRVFAAALITPTEGSATTTITSLVFNADGTISIEADQSGYLTNVGAFTAHFSYLAVPTPLTIALVGTGTLWTASGATIYLKASILEIGAAYPRTLNGALTIAGGTGRYAGATGVLYVSGVDEESLTDTIQIRGAIVTPASLLGGLLQ